MSTNNSDLFSGVLKSIVVGVISSVVLTLLFGKSTPGTLLKEMLRGGLEAGGVELGEDLGPTVADKIGKAARAASDFFEQHRTIYVYAPRAADRGPQCGIDPNGQTYCCNDANARFVIAYSGQFSPYAFGGVPYWRACR